MKIGFVVVVNMCFICSLKRWPNIKKIKMQRKRSAVVSCVSGFKPTHSWSKQEGDLHSPFHLCYECAEKHWMIIARKPTQTAVGCVWRQLTGPSWTMRQWETSWAHKRGLRSQRHWFPCQQDLCWESPPFKRFPSRTSATEGLVGIGEGISCGWQMKMQLCRSKMETVWVERPRAAAELCMDPWLSFTLWHFDYCLLSRCSVD